MAHAQDAPSVSAKRDVSPQTGRRRMRREEQLRTLAGEVALLRSELKELRQFEITGTISGRKSC